MNQRTLVSSTLRTRLVTQDSCWPLGEKLRQQFENDMRAEISRILEPLFDSDCTGQMFSIEACMRGRSQDSAKPTILLIGNHPSTLKDAKRELESSHIFGRNCYWCVHLMTEFPSLVGGSNLNQTSEPVDFEFWSSDGPVTWLSSMNSCGQVTDVYFDLGPYRASGRIPTKGLAIYIKHTSDLRPATANIVQLDQQIFLQTVYHAFHVDGSDRSSVVAPDPSLAIPSIESLSMIGRLLVWSDTRDWALIRVSSEELSFKMERALGESNGAIRIFEKAERPNSPHNKASTWTASRGELEVEISDTSTYIKLPNSRSLEKVYRACLINGSWSNGDSGAVVTNIKTGTTFGHILGGNRATGVAFIIPADKVVEDFRNLDFSSLPQLSANDAQGPFTSGVDKNEKLLQAEEFASGIRFTLSNSGYVSEDMSEDSDFELSQSPFLAARAEDLAREDHVTKRSESDLSYQDQPIDLSIGSMENLRSHISHSRHKRRLTDGKAWDKVTGRNRHPWLTSSSTSFERDVQLAQKLLEEDSDFNTRQESYNSILYRASCGGNEVAVRLLLQVKVDSDIKAKANNMALQEASAEGHEKIVRLLLENMVGLNAEDGGYNRALCKASFKGHEQIVKLLLEAGADVNASFGYHGSSLQTASYLGFTKVVKLLLENNADVNTNDGAFGSALRVASSRGHEQIVRLLLNAGADVNADSETFGSPLQTASHLGFTEVVKLLLEKKANVKADDGVFGSALQAASGQSHEQIVKLLLDAGADVNVRDKHGRTPLSLAAKTGKKAMVQLLLNIEGVDPNPRDNFGLTPLTLALWKRHEDVVSLLRDRVKDEAEVQISLTAANLTLENNHILKARITDSEEVEQDAQIDLDSVIGNDDGTFEWGWSNFSRSARNVSIATRDEKILLKADLRTRNGQYCVREIDLSECLLLHQGRIHYEL